MGLIPLPEKFPIVWDNPEDEKRFWMQDAMHAPAPVTPLSQGFGGAYLAEAFAEAFAHYSIPLDVKVKFFNNYYYMALTPRDLPKEEMEAMGKASQQKCEEVIGNYGKLWNEEWLPEIIEHVQFLEKFDVVSASDEDLKNHFFDFQKRVKRLWCIHFLNAVPQVLGFSMFDEIYCDLFQPTDKFEPLGLVDCVKNKTVDCGIAIWKLSQAVANNINLNELFQKGNPKEILDVLQQTSDDDDFKTQWNEVLDEYGRRNEHFIELNGPSWIEDPSPLVQAIQGYLRKPEYNALEDQANKEKAREEKHIKIKEKLSNLPEAVQGQFNGLFSAALLSVAASEDHNYWLDQRAVIYGGRRILNEIASRLVNRGVLNQQNDIYYLYYDEIVAILQGSESDTRSLIANRREVLRKSGTIAAPPVVGTEPEEEPPDTPLNRAMAKFFGNPPGKSDQPGVLLGNAASPGKVIGKAVVARSLDEARRVSPGDILVVQTTNPSWTPLFGVVAAVVTDTGGILCHCAIVAREYGIPAVVGLGMGTVAIQDGQQVEVDGDLGQVRVMEAV